MHVTFIFPHDEIGWGDCVSVSIRPLVTRDISATTGTILTKLGWILRLATESSRLQNYTDWPDGGAITSENTIKKSVRFDLVMKFGT